MRWIGLGLLGALFFKLFLGLAPIFYFAIGVGLGSGYLYNFFLWFLTKKKIFDDKKLFALVNLMVFLDLNIVFWLVYFVLPLTQELKFIPLGRIFHSMYFLFFIIVISASIILGLMEGLFTGLMAVFFIFLEKFIAFSASLISAPQIFSDGEVIVFLFLGVFLTSYLAKLAEDKKNELTEINQELTQKNKDLEYHRKELIQLEKKASLHQMAVSLNHEINNPLTSILANTQYYYEQFSANSEVDWPGFKNGLEDCLEDARKIKSLIKKIKKISEPIVSEYIPGVKMIDLDKSVAD